MRKRRSCGKERAHGGYVCGDQMEASNKSNFYFNLQKRRPKVTKKQIKRNLSKEGDKHVQVQFHLNRGPFVMLLGITIHIYVLSLGKFEPKWILYSFLTLSIVL